MKMNYSDQLEVFLLDSGSGEKENVTSQAEWLTSDSSIVTVGNKSVKGQVIARGEREGEAVITAKFGRKTATAPIQTVRAEMEVECTPRIMKEDGSTEFSDTAQVGEMIHWVALYKKAGAPNYNYKWTGTDELDDNRATAEKIYETPGLKEVHFWTEDTAGTTAETTCSITIK